tara:strand:+ start:179 stop:646 length:468 start_codon:yes stop_codon:yes gene_type:complete
MSKEDTNSPQSVENEQKEHYIEIPDGASPEYGVTPRRKYGEKTVKGIIIGQGDNRAIISIEEVKKLASLHLTYKDMADFFGCKETTFRDNFRSVVEKSRQVTKQRLMEAMLESAIVKQNPTILVWTSKNLLNWTDNPVSSESNQTLPWIDDQEDE